MTNVVSSDLLDMRGLYHVSKDSAYLYREMKGRPRFRFCKVSQASSKNYVIENLTFEPEEGSDTDLILTGSAKPRPLLVKTAENWHETMVENR